MPKKPQRNKRVILAAVLLCAVIAVGGAAAYFLVQKGEETFAYQTITLYYEDGTFEEFRPPDFNLPLPLRWIDASTNKEVTQIVVQMHVIASYSRSGFAASYSVTGSAQGRLYNALTDQYVATLWSMPISFSGGYLPSGQDVVVFSSTADVSTLQSLYSGWENYRTYYYVVWSPTPITVALHFSGGTTLQRTADPIRLAYRFTYYP